MTQEDKEFLAELAQEIRTQDNCATRNPIWCIMDKRYTPMSKGCGDEYRVVDCDGEEWTLGDFADYAFDCFSHRGDISLNNVKEEIMSCTDDDDLRSTLENLFKEVSFRDYRIVEVSLEEFITQNATGFLTKKSAEEHLRLNAHNYSTYAKAYALSAWRNPVYERVIEIIKNTNWEEEKAMKWKDEQFKKLLETELKKWKDGDSCEAKYRTEMLKELIDKLNE